MKTGKKISYLVIVSIVLILAMLLPTGSMARYIEIFSGGSGGTLDVAKIDIKIGKISDLRTYGYDTERYAKSVDVTVTNNSQVAMRGSLELELSQALPVGIDLYIDRNQDIVIGDGAITTASFPNSYYDFSEDGGSHTFKLFFDADYEELAVDYEPTITAKVNAVQIQPGAELSQPAQSTETGIYTLEGSLVDQKIWTEFERIFALSDMANYNGADLYTTFVHQDMSTYQQWQDKGQTSATKVTHISFPVLSLGNRTFQVAVVSNDYDTITGYDTTAKKGYLSSSSKITITLPNDAEAGKVSTIDVSDKNITIGPNQTLALTILANGAKPCWIDRSKTTASHANEDLLTMHVLRYMPEVGGIYTAWENDKDFATEYIPGGGGGCVSGNPYSYYHLETDGSMRDRNGDEKPDVVYSDYRFSIDNHIVPFNVTFERTFTAKTDYVKAKYEDADFSEMLDAVKEVYGNKSFSVLGDSISTYADISNNKKYNTSLHNAIYYQANTYAAAAHLYSYQYTYWGSFERLAGMNLCVNNGWSGGSICDSASWNNPGHPNHLPDKDYSHLYGKSAYDRCKELHQDHSSVTGNMAPDVIFVNMGTNDAATASRTSTVNVPENAADMDSWYRTILSNMGVTGISALDIEKEYWDDNGMVNNDSEKPFTASEGYALMLGMIRESYPDALIVCIPPVETNNDASRTDECLNNMGEIVRRLVNSKFFDESNIFGGTGRVILADQKNVINKNNYFYYMCDASYNNSKVSATGGVEGDNSRVHPNSKGHKVLFEEIVRALYADLVAQGEVSNIHYVNQDVLNAAGYIFEKGTADHFNYPDGAFPSCSFESFSDIRNATIDQITLPITRYTTASNGYYYTTVSVFPNSIDAVAAEEISNGVRTPLRQYRIKLSQSAMTTLVNRSENKTTDYNVRKMVTFDLEQGDAIYYTYQKNDNNIVTATPTRIENAVQLVQMNGTAETVVTGGIKLGHGESVAFNGTSDTMLWAYVPNTAFSRSFAEAFAMKKLFDTRTESSMVLLTFKSGNTAFDLAKNNNYGFMFLDLTMSKKIVDEKGILKTD